MRIHILLILGCLPLLISARGPAAGAGGENLQLRAQALETIYELNLNPDQLHALQKFAATSAANPPKPGRIPPHLRQALNNLCDALAKGNDEKISDLEDKVDQIEDQANIDDPEIDVTASARAHVMDVIKLVSAAQLANFISQESDGITGPAETLINALDDARQSDESDFKDFCTDTAKDVAVLVNGYDGSSAQLIESINDYLARVRKLSDDDYKAKRNGLESEAHKIVGTHDSFTTLRHWTERQIAETLANPELSPAIEARLAHAPKESKE